MNRVLSIVKKDVTQIFRNRFMAVITFLAIFIYAIVFHVMPSKVEETYSMGFYFEKGREAVEEQISEEEGVEAVWADNEKELKKLVEDEDVQAGLSFTLPEGKPKIVLYTSSQTPEEIREAGDVIAREAAYNLSGYPLNVAFDEVVIGPDLLGKQIPARNKMRILFVVVLLAVEFYALGNLISEEIRKKTADAILVTPVSISEFMTAKVATGIFLTFFEGLLAAFLLNIISINTVVPFIVFLLLGALLVVAFSFVLGTISRSFLGLTAYGTLFMVVFMGPAFTLIFPGGYSFWIKAVPSYYLIIPLDGIVNYGYALSDYLSEIAYLASFDLVMLLLGLYVLRRRLT
ncbi:MAG TPA: ABC transporter permease [Actinobacteria bacterium]|mgnify:CR=1 FL=1|nr:ABC transporter permease [Actinomycetota bacterium]